jgi:hypothetical protein
MRLLKVKSCKPCQLHHKYSSAEPINSGQIARQFGYSAFKTRSTVCAMRCMFTQPQGNHANALPHTSRDSTSSNVTSGGTRLLNLTLSHQYTPCHLPLVTVTSSRTNRCQILERPVRRHHTSDWSKYTIAHQMTQRFGCPSTASLWIMRRPITPSHTLGEEKMIKSTSMSNMQATVNKVMLTRLKEFNMASC